MKEIMIKKMRLSDAFVITGDLRSAADTRRWRSEQIGRNSSNSFTMNLVSREFAFMGYSVTT